MIIDNVTSDHRTRQLTTRIGSGHTLIHERSCRIQNVKAWSMKWAEMCDCYISRLELIDLPDGTPVPIPEEYTRKVREEAWDEALPEIRRAEAQAAYWKHRFGWMFLFGSAGWVFSIARGIWGF